MYRASAPMFLVLVALVDWALCTDGVYPRVFGVTQDLERPTNLTARREYRISGWKDRLYNRSLLTRLPVGH